MKRLLTKKVFIIYYSEVFASSNILIDGELGRIRYFFTVRVGTDQNFARTMWARVVKKLPTSNSAVGPSRSIINTQC